MCLLDNIQIPLLINSICKAFTPINNLSIFLVNQRLRAILERQKPAVCRAEQSQDQATRASSTLVPAKASIVIVKIFSVQSTAVNLYNEI